MSQKKEKEEGKVIEGHVYDGIEELDYGPPMWFNALFGVTILFAVSYWLYYSIGGGPSLLDEYHDAQKREEIAMASRSAQERNQMPTENELRALLADASKKKLGHDVFASKCVSCHGAAGQGGIGPNLTDNYWIHGGKLVDVYATIFNGVGDKGMPPWGPSLSPNEIQGLVIYIRSLAGTNPPGAKAPQGNAVQIE